MSALHILLLFSHNQTTSYKRVIYLFSDDGFSDVDEVVLAECAQLWDDCE